MPPDNKEALTHHKTVFVVEDDLMLAQAYEIKLKKESVDVWVAHDGDEAMSFISKDETPSVVLLDLMLPDKSGFEVLEKMRQTEKWKKVPVIVVSNLGQQQDIDRAKKFGVEDYLVKANIRIAEVIEKIKKFF